MDVSFGPYRLRRQDRMLTGPAGPLDLSSRSFDILCALIDRPGEVVSKDAIFGAVWPGVVVEENTLQVHISALRKALPPDMIVTVHGRGYKYAGPTPEEGSSERSEARPSGDKPSIAVLPFRNMSSDPEQAYFSDGIAEDIVTQLSRYRQFIVISRNSSFRFRGQDIDLRDIGQKLGAHFIVEGSVRRAGNRIRVSAQLVEAETSAQIWAENYDRNLEDIFDIQDEITEMVTSRVSRNLVETVVHRSRPKPTSSLSAYECYLQAWQLLYGYETHPLSLEWAERAVKLDPSFAAAFAVLSDSEVSNWFLDDDPARLVRARELARPAISLDKNEARAHGAAGLAATHSRRYGEARAHLDVALSLNPNESRVRTIRALLNCYTRRLEEAASDVAEALRRDPFASEWLWDVKATIEMASGAPSEALQSYERADYVPQWGVCNQIVCLAQLGRMAEAVAVYRQLCREHAGWLKGRWIGNPGIVFETFEYQDDIDRYTAMFRQVQAAVRSDPAG